MTEVVSYHQISSDHWETCREFLRWCDENNVKAKWKHGHVRPKNWIGYELDNVSESQRKAYNCQHWEIENMEDAMAAKLAWSE